MCFCSPGTKLVEHYACRGTKLIASHIFIPGYKVLCGAVARLPRASAASDGGPDLSPFTNLSWVQEQNAKTMTSLLIIPSVLCAVLFKNLSLDRKVYFLSKSLFNKSIESRKLNVRMPIFYP